MVNLVRRGAGRGEPAEVEFGSVLVGLRWWLAWCAAWAGKMAVELRALPIEAELVVEMCDVGRSDGMRKAGVARRGLGVCCVVLARAGRGIARGLAGAMMELA